MEVNFYITSDEYSLFELAELFSDFSSSWLYQYSDIEGKMLQAMLQIDVMLFNVFGAGTIILEILFCIFMFVKNPKAGAVGKWGASFGNSIGFIFIISILTEFGIEELQNIKMAPILIICLGVIQSILLNPQKRNQSIV